MIFPFREVILKSYDFSDILFAINCRRQYHLNEVQISLRSNRARRKANKTAQVSLRTLGQRVDIFVNLAWAYAWVLQAFPLQTDRYRRIPSV